MNKLISTLLLLLFPGLVLAESSSMSFAPPASDYSVVFLANLFGIVDGVLSGTGSQIMGTMFGIFNSAVLALGGIIIMYTLIVSTMNTAHEGQMLGQKWSSIWVPLRSTIGLALLIPKASGYCLMQIFVMWLVVQGVGAADKIWDAALSYLNRGGVVVQAQITPQELIGGGAIGSIAEGARSILAGQVCMLGLQKQLENQRELLLDAKSNNNSGDCANNTNQDMQDFCNTPVPDFISSVNAVTYQNSHNGAGPWTLNMPNFDSGPYQKLNGVCGTIQWNSVTNLSNSLANLAVNPTTGVSQTLGNPTTEQVNQSNGIGFWGSMYNETVNETKGATVTLNAQEIAITQMARAIAIQQMYVDLSLLANVIVDNDPQIVKSNMNNGNSFSQVANQQFGIPLTQNGNICTNYGEQCMSWGPVAGGSVGGGTLFRGNEFFNAINSYNGVMMPTLNLVDHLDNAVNNSKATEFIREASAKGWIMAGSYFFDLAMIQGGSGVTNSKRIDSGSGLDNSISDPNKMMAQAFQNGGCGGDFQVLCHWFQGNTKPVEEVQSLIAGSQDQNNNSSKLLSPPTMSSNMTLVNNLNSSTVYGLINNSLMMQLPGQPGLKPMTFANSLNLKTDLTMYKLERQNFACGKVVIMFFSFCLGELLGNLFYNIIFLTIYNIFMEIIGQMIQQIIYAFMMVPLQGMLEIFKQGLATLSGGAGSTNPIVALATMGVNYINYTGNLWLILLNMALSSVILPPLFFVIILTLPLVMAWASIMVAIGFITAYYIPALPYIIFILGALGWLITVIEAMVAAPIVALGVTHPEGHEAFGRGEAAVMILLNVFLRPSMMIIGYISAIALSYVGIWLLNAGYEHGIAYIQAAVPGKGNTGSLWTPSDLLHGVEMPSGKGGYVGWSGIYAYFFAILIYTTMYLLIVQKAFTLISYLPDKVLRWIGGSPETLGQDTSQWGEEVKGRAERGGESIYPVQQQMGKQMGAYGMKGIKSTVGKISEKAGGSGSMSGSGSGGEATPPSPDKKE